MDSAGKESASISPETQAKLREMGHKIIVGGKQGDGSSILLDPDTGVAFGVVDKRSPEGKASK